MITMKHKLALLKLKLCVTELNLMTRSHFIEILMILTKYVFDLCVRLTEFSVTMESVTLRFYCIYYDSIMPDVSKYVTVPGKRAHVAQIMIFLYRHF